MAALIRLLLKPRYRIVWGSELGLFSSFRPLSREDHKLESGNSVPSDLLFIICFINRPHVVWCVPDGCKERGEEEADPAPEWINHPSVTQPLTEQSLNWLVCFILLSFMNSQSGNDNSHLQRSHSWFITLFLFSVMSTTTFFYCFRCSIKRAKKISYTGSALYALTLKFYPQGHAAS